MGVKRLSSTGVARLSTIAVIAASAIPIHPTNRQAGREKTKNAILTYFQQGRQQ